MCEAAARGRQQAAVNEQARRRDDFLEDALERWLRTAPETFTLAEAAVGCRLAEPDRVERLSRGAQRRLGAALTRQEFGKRRMRVAGKRMVVWWV